MNKVNFTAERVSNFRCELGKQQSILWDAKIPGLGLRATSKGAKSYIFETRLHGKTLRLTIGDIRIWAIGKAQSEAIRLKSLTDQGIDPRQLRQAQKEKAEAAALEAKRQQVTLGDVWPVYLEAHRAKWSTDHYDAHLRLAAKGGDTKKRGKGERTAGPLAPLMPLLMSELTSKRITDWLHTEALKRPTSAALSFRLLRAFANWASDIPDYQGLIPDDAFSARSIRDAVPKNRTKEGDSLQREQLSAWFNAVLQLPNPVIRTYLQALLLTGARRREMGNLRWEDVDFQWRSITIRDKVEGERTIPLPPYLAKLFQELKHLNDTPPSDKKLKELEDKGEKWKPSPWVFSSPASSDGKLAEPRIAHTEALKKAGLPHVSLHGLRRSFGTLCEWVEVPSGISAQIMGHKPSALAEKHYRRRPTDLLRKWHDKIEAWILTEAKINWEPEGAALRAVA